MRCQITDNFINPLQLILILITLLKLLDVFIMLTRVLTYKLNN